jgi:hypothetical protein
MPIVVSKNLVTSRPIAAALLDALSARPAAALLVTPFVHLYTAGPAPVGPLNVPGDFTEATFVGYAATALPLPLLGPINGANNVLGKHEEVNFLAGAVVAPGETILGYWVDEAAAGGASLYFAEAFDTPIPIVNAGDFISLDVIAMFLMVQLGIF